VPRPDLLIVARGGGSLEDLWAFNEEVVVRAAAASDIPLISAVGHETDTTLIDLAADQRAPTPTAAAELAVPVRADLALRLGQHEQRMLHGIQRELQQLGHRVVGLGRGLPDPVSLVGHASQRLDDLAERLPHGLSSRVERAGHHLAQIGARLGSPDRLLRDAEARLRPCAEQLGYLSRSLLRERTSELARLAGMLSSLSYQGVLARGFALVRDERGALVPSAASARTCAALEIEFHDGRVATRRAGRPASRPAADDPQKRLL
jgi:exodeoxyribonuclease VII large subunit